ncbi:MAG: metallophosphoesterase [Cyanobium sp.]
MTPLPPSRPRGRRALLLGVLAAPLLLLPAGFGQSAAPARRPLPPPPPPAVEPQPANVHLLAVADTCSGDSRQQAVAERMAEVHRRRPVDLVVLGGDNIYPDGDLRRVEASFERPYRALLAAGVPFHAVLGNHDIRTGNGDPQIAYRPFGMQGRWYSLRRGPVELFMLDTNMNARWQHQLPWLKKALAASSAPWKVVVGHHPIYSSGFYGDDPAAIARLTHVFERYGVQLYINGHEHNYERSRPLDGTTYLQVGGGGAALRVLVPNERSARAVSVHSFAEISADARELRIVAWDAKGQRIDEAVLRR